MDDRSDAEALYDSLFADSSRGASSRKYNIIELYDHLRPSMMAYLGGLGLSSDKAEDVIQDAFLRLVRHIAEGKNEKNLRGWLFRVAHNLTMDAFRNGLRPVPDSVEAESTLALQIADDSPNPEEIAMRRQEVRRIGAAMARLTELQRCSVLLRAEGLRYREIADVLGMSTQRVGELVQRALARLAGDI